MSNYYGYDPNSPQQPPQPEYSLPDNSYRHPDYDQRSYNLGDFGAPAMQDPQPAPFGNGVSKTWKVLGIVASLVAVLLLATVVFFGAKYNSEKQKADDLTTSTAQAEQDQRDAFDVVNFPSLYSNVTSADASVEEAWNNYWNAEIGSTEEDNYWTQYYYNIGVCIEAVDIYNKKATEGEFPQSLFIANGVPAYINLETYEETDCGIGPMVDRNS